MPWPQGHRRAAPGEAAPAQPPGMSQDLEILQSLQQTVNLCYCLFLFLSQFHSGICVVCSACSVAVLEALTVL